MECRKYSRITKEEYNRKNERDNIKIKQQDEIAGSKENDGD